MHRTVSLAQILHDGITVYVYGYAWIRRSPGTWHQHDGLGSVRAVLDASGAVQTTTSYDPWGIPQTALSDSFGFTGELHDGDLVHLRARWYHPSIGTFTARDPFEGFDTQPYSLHPYQYAYSVPTTWSDPSGERPCPDPDADCGAPSLSFGERLLTVLNNANFYPDLYAQVTRSRGLNPLYVVFDRFPTAAQYYDPYNDPALAERAEQYYGWDGAMVVDMIAVALGLWRANHLQQHGGGVAGVCEPLILVAIGVSRLGGLDQLMFGPDGRGGGGGRSKGKDSDNYGDNLSSGPVRGNLKVHNEKYWKKLGIDAHEVKRDLMGQGAEVKLFDLARDSQNDTVWIIRKSRREPQAPPVFVGTMEEVITMYRRNQ